MDDEDNIEDDDNEADRDKGNNGDNPALLNGILISESNFRYNEHHLVTEYRKMNCIYNSSSARSTLYLGFITRLRHLQCHTYDLFPLSHRLWHLKCLLKLLCRVDAYSHWLHLCIFTPGCIFARDTRCKVKLAAFM